MQTQLPRNIYLFVFDSMTDCDAVSALAAVRNAQVESALEDCRIVTAAIRPGMITTGGGTRIQPDALLGTVSPVSSAMLILPGGRAWESGAHAAALELASRFVAVGTPVAAIGGAARRLLRAGFLDSLRAGENVREYLLSTGDHGTAFYCGVPACTDRSGPAGKDFVPVELAREIFRRISLRSPDPNRRALPVARGMLMQSERPACCVPDGL